MPTDAQGSGLPWVDEIARCFEPYAFVDFHRVGLPALVEQHGHLVLDDLRGAPSLAFRRGADAFTWVASEAGIQVVEGDAQAPTRVLLSEGTFSEFLHELLTASGAVMTGRARIDRGELAGWRRWEPAIQSLCSGREIYGPKGWDTLVDRSGGPLDLERRFSVSDDPLEMRRYLETAGYLHVENVFGQAEIEDYRAEV